MVRQTILISSLTTSQSVTARKSTIRWNGSFDEAVRYELEPDALGFPNQTRLAVSEGVSHESVIHVDESASKPLVVSICLDL